MGLRAGPSVMDMSTAMMTCNAVLGALFARERSGRGQFIESALFDTAVTMVGFHAMNYLVSGDGADPVRQQQPRHGADGGAGDGGPADFRRLRERSDLATNGDAGAGTARPRGTPGLCDDPWTHAQSASPDGDCARHYSDEAAGRLAHPNAGRGRAGRGDQFDRGSVRFRRRWRRAIWCMPFRIRSPARCRTFACRSDFTARRWPIRSPPPASVSTRRKSCVTCWAMTRRDRRGSGLWRGRYQITSRMSRPNIVISGLVSA